MTKKLAPETAFDNLRPTVRAQKTLRGQLYRHTMSALKRDFQGNLTHLQMQHITGKLRSHQFYLLDRSIPIDPDSASFNFGEKRDAFMDHFGPDGIKEEEFFAGVIMSPVMLMYDMDRMSTRVGNIADNFKNDGLTRGPYVRSALKSAPTILSLTDQSVIDHLESPMRDYASYGLARDAYIRIALKNIRLVGATPEKTSMGIKSMLTMVDMGVCTPSPRQMERANGNQYACVFNYLEGAPSKLGYSQENYLLRMDMAQRGPKTYDGFGVFIPTMGKLMKQYRDNFGTTFSLEVLARDNMKLYSELYRRGLWPKLEEDEGAEGGQLQPRPQIAA